MIRVLHLKFLANLGTLIFVQKRGQGYDVFIYVSFGKTEIFISGIIYEYGTGRQTV